MNSKRLEEAGILAERRKTLGSAKCVLSTFLDQNLLAPLVASKSVA